MFISWKNQLQSSGSIKIISLLMITFLTIFGTRISFSQESGKFCSRLPIVIVKLSQSFPMIDMSDSEKSKAKITNNDMLVYDNNPKDDKSGPLNCFSLDKTFNQLETPSEKIDGVTLNYRGSSSLGFPKHQIGVKLPKIWDSKNFMNMPFAGKSWVFSAENPGLDGTYLRNTLSFYLQNQFAKLMPEGNKTWAPRTRFFELFLDQGFKLYLKDSLPNQHDQTYLNSFVYLGSSSSNIPDIYYGYVEHPTQTPQPIQYIKAAIKDPANFSAVFLRPMKDTGPRFITSNEVAQYITFPQTFHFPEKAISAKNDYVGLYILAEKIEFSKSRVAVAAKMPALMYKIDQPGVKEGDIPVHDDVTNQNFIVYDYQGKNVVDEEKNSLMDFWPGAFSLWSGSIRPNGLKVQNIRVYNNQKQMQINTDADSFAVAFLLNELIKDPDGYNRNTFFYQTLNDTNLTMYSGPSWDKNLGYDLYVPMDKFPRTGGYNGSGEPIYRGTDKWTFVVKHQFWKDVIKQPNVQDKICSYWMESRKDFLTDKAIDEFLQNKSEWIRPTTGNFANDNPVKRDCDKYYPDTNNPNATCIKEFQPKIDDLKQYVNGRLIWMTRELGSTLDECKERIKTITQSQ